MRPRRGRCATGSTPPRLVLNRLTIRSPHHFGTDLKDVSLTLAGGEILGIAGIAGNGQSELMDALSGEIPAGKPGKRHDRRRRSRTYGTA